MRICTPLVVLLSFARIAFSQGITVSIHSISGYSPYDSFAYQAARALEKAFNSEQFKDRVLQGDFKQTNDLNNQELYETIMRAHEVAGPGGTDGVVDLRLRTVNLEEDTQYWVDNCQIGSDQKTIGIDGASTGVFATCWTWLERWHNENNVSELAGHYAHEYMHLLGFSHNPPLIRGKHWAEKTFVYEIGEIVAELIDKNELTALNHL